MHSNLDQTNSDNLAEAAMTNDRMDAEVGLLGSASTATTCTFTEVLDFSKGFSSTYQSVEHKPDVKPIFLGFKRVTCEVSKIPLIQVAVAVGIIVGPKNMDAIQPMRNGWQIYVKIDVDRQKLLAWDWTWQVS